MSRARMLQRVTPRSRQWMQKLTANQLPDITQKLICELREMQCVNMNASVLQLS